MRSVSIITTISFKHEKKETFEANIAGIGYYPNAAAIVSADKTLIEDLRSHAENKNISGKMDFISVVFGSVQEAKDKRYCEMRKISKDIAKKEKLARS